MSKCFITKLPSSVDNDNLPVLGQLRIKMLKQNALPDNSVRAIQLATNNSITVKISGAHFTDNTLTSNNGNIKTITDTDGDVTLYVSNDTDAIITIDNKYSLTKLICNICIGEIRHSPHSIYFDIEDIKYCTNLNYLDLHATQASGDISALSKLTNLIHLELGKSQVSGDISVLSKLTNIQDLNVENTQVSGDISALSNLINLNVLSLGGTQTSGDISALSKLTNITDLIINGTSISGTFDNFTSYTELKVIWAIEALLTGGDMSKIPGNCMAIYTSLVNGRTVCTWSAKSRQNVKMLMISGDVYMDTTSIDNMLIDQATCKFNISEYPEWQRTIYVNGTRTSDSDAAVTAIQNMGVTIAGITKAS